MATLKIASLNLGRMLESRTRDFITASQQAGADIPDVWCLQDIPFAALPLFQRMPYVAFAPMTNHFINGVRGVVGNAIVSRYFMTNITHHTTWGDGALKDLQGINEKNQRYLGEESDRLVEATEDRVATCATIIKDGVEFDIATTHGMWVRNGVTNDVQRESTRRLIDALTDQALERDGLVVAADMNFGRDGEIYKEVMRYFCDCVPRSIVNTLDPNHPVVKKGITVVSDYVMVQDDGRPACYDIIDVRLTSGISDHCMLSATVIKP